MPGFREALDAYYFPMLDLGRHLMRLLALSLGEPEDCFDAAFRAPSASLRLLRYPPQPADAESNQLGAGAHTDWGAITLLAQDDCGGLEVENARGEWLRAVPVPDTFVVNLGDMIARWTNGAYHSNMHRVMNNVSGRNRHSLVLFFNPEYYTRRSRACRRVWKPPAATRNIPPAPPANTSPSATANHAPCHPEPVEGSLWFDKLTMTKAN